MSDVEWVWIDGVAKKRNGKLVGLDWRSVNGRLHKSRESILEKFARIPEPDIRGAWAPLWGLESPAMEPAE